MPSCTTCRLFQSEIEASSCLHINRPGGLELTRKIILISKLLPGARILDLAGGQSGSLQFLRGEGFQVIGLDISHTMLLQGKVNASETELIQADACSIPLETNSQQAVLMECAFSLVGNSDVLLSEIKRVLTPGGKLIITDIYIRGGKIEDRNILAHSHCLANVMNEEEITSKIILSGFDNIIMLDQTFHLNNWIGAMVFKLGSIKAFYEQLADCHENAASLECTLRGKIHLGYYSLIAEKSV